MISATTTESVSDWPTIADAKRLAKKYTHPGVIIFTFSGDGRCAFSSYGADRRRCDAMGKWGRRIAKMLESRALAPPAM